MAKAVAWKEIVVFVHGITPEPYVQAHAQTYDGLYKLVNDELKVQQKKPLGSDKIYVEWGWQASQGKDKNLAEAQRKLTLSTFEEYVKAKDFTFNPTRAVVKGLRNMFMYGIGDMFYYVSEDGKQSIRNNVFETILKKLEDSSRPNKSSKKYSENISLTLFGHSAGTVILHDLLFHIFFQKIKGRNNSVAYEDRLNTVRVAAQNGKIRLRKFYTFGSPITPLTFRSDNLVQMAANSSNGREFLKPEDIGIKSYRDLKKSLPRWVNFWDPDDLISFPVEHLYKDKGKIIEDKCIDVSDNPFDAHGKYWTNKKVAKYIAETY